jgi:hypothetical protein
MSYSNLLDPNATGEIIPMAFEWSRMGTNYGLPIGPEPDEAMKITRAYMYNGHTSAVNVWLAKNGVWGDRGGGDYGLMPPSDTSCIIRNYSLAAKATLEVPMLRGMWLASSPIAGQGDTLYVKASVADKVVWTVTGIIYK